MQDFLSFVKAEILHSIGWWIGAAIIALSIASIVWAEVRFMHAHKERKTLKKKMDNGAK